MGRKRGVPHRSKVKIARDRREIARRYLRGESQETIGVALGLSQQSVSLELKRIQQAWLRDSVQDVAARKAHELAKLEQIEQTYWQAWETSKGERSQRTHVTAAYVKVPTRRKGDEYKIDQVVQEKKTFTPDEMQRLLDELWRTQKYHGMYTYFALLSELGPRRGEGLGLRRKDIDFDSQTIVIAQQVTRNPMTNAKTIQHRRRRAASAPY